MSPPFINMVFVTTTSNLEIFWLRLQVEFLSSTSNSRTETTIVFTRNAGSWKTWKPSCIGVITQWVPCLLCRVSSYLICTDANWHVISSSFDLVLFWRVIQQSCGTLLWALRVYGYDSTCGKGLSNYPFFITRKIVAAGSYCRSTMLLHFTGFKFITYFVCLNLVLRQYRLAYVLSGPVKIRKRRSETNH